MTAPRRMLGRRGLVAGAGAAALLGAGARRARAQERAGALVLGLAFETTAIDPHFYLSAPNQLVTRHIFDTLLVQDARQRLLPGVAESWRVVDATTWEFRLRPDARFHDGGALTADDVAFTLARAVDVPGSPGGWGLYLRPVARAAALDAQTLRVVTHAPYPILPVVLSTVGIVSRRRGTGAATADYNAGDAAVGSGPFRFAEWLQGQRVVLRRNDAWWGPAVPWSAVTLRHIPDSAARVAALLSGDVDAIEFVPPSAAPALARRPDLSIAQTVANRVIYLALDSARERSPFVTDRAGRPLDRNPLRDGRVRRAISRAIDRAALVERVMEGAAAPAGNVLPPDYFGIDPAVVPDPYDPDGARALLAASGWPDGFGITLHGSNNRYVNDAQIAVAIGQMLARVGIAVRVDTMPNAVFRPRAARHEFSMMLLGWGSETGEAGGPLRALLATPDPLAGAGQVNYGRYSNPAVDALLDEALATLDDARRDGLLRRAGALAMQDCAIVPLYFTVASWALRRPLAYTPRQDEYTLAAAVRPV